MKLFHMAVAALLAMGGSAFAEESYHWVQYGPGGVEARAITHASACPKAAIDDKPVEMTVRSQPGENYPVLVCAMPIPKGAASASIADVPLVLPVADPKRILIIGDTGCRLKGAVAQSCNDISSWPFRVDADAAAVEKPDLVIHVGDFHYRESACPLSLKGCAGSPFGDSWDVWRADFFSPAETLLNTAPWVFVRGNHEECDRGGKGWSRTLDPYPFVDNNGCLGLGKPFVADLGAVLLYVMDVSTADEAKANAIQAAFYKEQFQATHDLGDKPIWLAFHRPIWSAVEVKNGKSEGDNHTLAMAARETLAKNVQAILSGHQHTFSVMSYAEDLPIQIVSGHGGDNLDFAAPKDPAGLQINGVTVNGGKGMPGFFGYSMLERDATGWSITDYDLRGAKLARCRMTGRSVACI